MNLINLLVDDGNVLRRIASTNGGEYAGACPFCGGNDRFRVWPKHKGGRFWCRVCGKSGDAIQYLHDFRGLSFWNACHELNITPALSRTDYRREKPTFTPKELTAPNDVWQSRATAFMEQAQSTLWTDAGTDARVFLLGKGLTDDSMREVRLGWNPTDVFLDRETWGLPFEKNDKDNPRKLWLPAGLVIPCFTGGEIIRLRIRRPEGEPRYVLVPGSVVKPMTWGMDKKAVIIVESELDGLLLHQEAGDLTAVIALGSAQAKPDRSTHEAVKAALVVLVSLDADEAGAKSAWQWWMKEYPRSQRWPCVEGKDPSAAWLKGLDLRQWVVAGIFETFERFERFCIQTVDGGISDEEAITTMELL